MTTRWHFAGAALFVLWACGSCKSDDDGRCKENRDCEPGSACHDGECLALCGEGLQCNPGSRCEGGLCVPASGPQITAVLGNDPSNPGAVLDGIVIRGNVLAGASVGMRGESGEVPVTVRRHDAAEIEVVLPPDVGEGRYVLSVASAGATEEATVQLTLPWLSGDALIDRVNTATTSQISTPRLRVGATAETVAAGDHGHPRGGNYLHQADFAAGVEGWSFVDSPAGGASVIPIADGIAGLNVVQNQENTVVLLVNDTRVPVNRSATYRVSGSFRLLAGGGTAGVYHLAVVLYDASGAAIAGAGTKWWFHAANAIVPPAAEWRSHHVLFGAGTARPFPREARYMTVGIILNQDAQTNGNRVYQAQGLGLFDVVTHEAWQAFPFATGYGNYSIPPGGFQTVQFRKTGDEVCLRGLAKKLDDTAIPAAAVLGTLPVGYRPPATLLYFVGGHTAGDRVDVGSNGQVVNTTSDGQTWTSLDGICFSTTP